MISEEGLTVWKTLQLPTQRTLLDMVRASHFMGEPTSDLLKALCNIAIRLADHPNFMYYENLDEMRHEAVVQMIQYWDKCDPHKCGSSHAVHAFFNQIALNTFQHYLSREKKQRAIQAGLLESAKDGTLEFYYRP